MPSNTAAYFTEAKAPFEIKPAPMGSPGPNEVLVKTHAIAINPADYKVQQLDLFSLAKPVILGEDVAGTVISTGSAVTRLKPDDRIIGLAAGMAARNDAEKAFQEYVVLREELTAKIPDELDYSSAVVLPLGIATASAALFLPKHLGLDFPSVPARTKNGKVLLVWGGASSVGSNAIQLATAAGYDVFTTCSEKNFAMVKELGAKMVFDYNTAGVVQEIVDALQKEGKEFAGTMDAIGGAALKSCINVSQAVGTTYIATVTPYIPDIPEGMKVEQVQALSIMNTEVAKVVWGEFLEKALAEGSYVPAPEKMIVGKGLDAVQEGVDIVGKGVSGRKIVVVL